MKVRSLMVDFNCLYSRFGIRSESVFPKPVAFARWFFEKTGKRIDTFDVDSVMYVIIRNDYQYFDDGVECIYPDEYRIALTSPDRIEADEDNKQNNVKENKIESMEKSIRELETKIRSFEFRIETISSKVNDLESIDRLRRLCKPIASY